MPEKQENTNHCVSLLITLAVVGTVKFDLCVVVINVCFLVIVVDISLNKETMKPGKPNYDGIQQALESRMKPPIKFFMTFPSEKG